MSKKTITQKSPLYRIKIVQLFASENFLPQIKIPKSKIQAINSKLIYIKFS